MDRLIFDEVLKQLHKMSESSQNQVLGFAKALNHSKIRGVSGSQFLRFAGMIPSDDIALLREAIKQDVNA